MKCSYLVRAVPPDHVEDGLVSSRVKPEPGVGFDDLSIEDDDLSAIRYEALNLAPRKYLVPETRHQRPQDDLEDRDHIWLVKL